MHMFCKQHSKASRDCKRRRIGVHNGTMGGDKKIRSHVSIIDPKGGDCAHG